MDDDEADEAPVKKPKKPAKGNVLVAPRKPGKGIPEIIKEYKEVTKKFEGKIKGQPVLRDKWNSVKQAVADANKFPDNIKKLKVSDHESKKRRACVRFNTSFVSQRSSRTLTGTFT